jgi:hypothetical protein
MIDFTWSDKKLESPKIKHDCFDFVLKNDDEDEKVDLHKMTWWWRWIAFFD